MTLPANAHSAKRRGKKPHYHRGCQCEHCKLISNLLPNLHCICSYCFPLRRTVDLDFDPEDDFISQPETTPSKRGPDELSLTNKAKARVDIVLIHKDICGISFHSMADYCHIMPRHLWKQDILVRQFTSILLCN
jgi:hypothetical protein